MIIDNLNLNQLRVFECVYRTRSMTAAAKELHLTQSGVSQHVKALEEVLGIKLFDRIKQRLIPTSAAGELFRKTADSLNAIEQTLSDIKGGERQFKGIVSVGMPIEFGNNVVMPLLSEFCAKHAAVRFQIKLGFPTEMNAGILAGELDFAFVDAFALDPRITTEKVYAEMIHLCATPAMVRAAKVTGRWDRKAFEGLEYVDYLPGEPVLRAWFHHHFNSRDIDVNVRATVMDVQSVAKFILSGKLAGVLPGHLTDNLEAQGVKLHKFKGSGKTLHNAISLAYLPERTLSPAAAAAKDWLGAEIRSRPH